MATAEETTRRDELVGRLFMNALGAFDLLSVYLGDELGLYRALQEKGALTSAELAEAAGIHERYAREWLEQQAASELLDVEPNGAERRFRLPEGHDEALLEPSSLNYVAPLARGLVGAMRPLDSLLAAFRTGEGVPYADYGDNLHEAQAAFTRPMFENKEFFNDVMSRIPMGRLEEITGHYDHMTSSGAVSAPALAHAH